jgi:hypothetical protein
MSRSDYSVADVNKGYAMTKYNDLIDAHVMKGWVYVVAMDGFFHSLQWGQNLSFKDSTLLRGVIRKKLIKQGNRHGSIQDHKVCGI